jgi:iron uptake system component EfeO
VSRRLVCLLLVAPLLLAACGDKKDDKEHEGLSDSTGATHVAVTISDKGCDPAAITTTQGKVAFDVTNSGSAAVTEFYVYKGKAVQGEVENVTPGVKRTLTLSLKAGDYTTKCPNGKPETGTLTVTDS